MHLLGGAMPPPPLPGGPDRSLPYVGGRAPNGNAFDLVQHPMGSGSSRRDAERTPLDISYETMIARLLDDHVHQESDIFTHKNYVNTKEI